MTFFRHFNESIYLYEMETPAHIRTYESRDHEACMIAFKTNFPKYFTRNEIDDFDRFLTRLENLEIKDNPPYFVVELNEKVIGCSGFKEQKDAGTVAFVWGLIHKDYHKMNFGKQLLTFRLAEIKRLFPNRQVILDTTQHTFSFFEKYGFETLKITENSYEEGMHRYDMTLKSQTE